MMLLMFFGPFMQTNFFSLQQRNEHSILVVNLQTQVSEADVIKRVYVFTETLRECRASSTAAWAVSNGMLKTVIVG